MEFETTAPCSPGSVYRPATVLPETVQPQRIEPHTIRSPLEYGCVDWYPYAGALEQPPAAIG
jgi:hypothetical protein